MELHSVTGHVVVLQKMHRWSQCSILTSAHRKYVVAAKDHLQFTIWIGDHHSIQHYVAVLNVHAQ